VCVCRYAATSVVQWSRNVVPLAEFFTLFCRFVVRKQTGKKISEDLIAIILWDTLLFEPVNKQAARLCVYGDKKAHETMTSSQNRS